MPNISRDLLPPVVLYLCYVRGGSGRWVGRVDGASRRCGGCGGVARQQAADTGGVGRAGVGPTRSATGGSTQGMVGVGGGAARQAARRRGSRRDRSGGGAERQEVGWRGGVGRWREQGGWRRREQEPHKVKIAFFKIKNRLDLRF